MFINKMPVFKISLDELPVDYMTANKMSVDVITVDEINVVKMPVEEMSVDDMTVFEMTCCHSSISCQGKRREIDRNIEKAFGTVFAKFNRFHSFFHTHLGPVL